jgi:hypothetical protein
MELMATGEPKHPIVHLDILPADATPISLVCPMVGDGVDQQAKRYGLKVPLPQVALLLIAVDVPRDFHVSVLLDEEEGQEEDCWCNVAVDFAQDEREMRPEEPR